MICFEPLENRTLFSVSTGVSLAGENTAADDLTGLTALRADSAFAGIDGTGVSVAVLDTGADLANSAFGPDADRNGVADRIVYQYDFADDTPDASDTDGHGTQVASIIGSDDPRFPGVAPDVNLIILKVFNDGSDTASTSAVESALTWCADHAQQYNIAAVNLSLGWGDFPDPVTNGAYADTLSRLVSENVIPIAAGGNDYFTQNSQPGVAYPAADPNALAIGAVWSTDAGGPFVFNSGAQDYTTGPDRVASFSERDPDQTDLFAPGTFITGAAIGGGLSTLSGTSQATAYVSGLAALSQQLALRDLGRRLSFPEFRSLAQSSGTTLFDGDDENTNVHATFASYKRVDAHGLAQAVEGLRPQSTAPVSAKPFDLNGDGNPDLIWRNYSNGNDSVWFMNANQQPTSFALFDRVPDTNWRLVGSGDFNHDGYADLVWYHARNHLVSIWLMDGTTRLANPIVGVFTWPGFSAAAVGDVNNDGNPDIVFRSPSDGRNFAWELGGGPDGIGMLGANFLPSAPAAWHLAGIGDVNGDGKSDLLWHHDLGMNSIWFMDGPNTLLSHPLIAPSHPGDGAPLALEDLNNDGHADIVSYDHDPNSASVGRVTVWSMDGATVLGRVTIGTASHFSWLLAGSDDERDLLQLT